MLPQLLRWVYRVYNRQVWKDYLAACTDPTGFQRNRLLQIVERNRDTDFGKRHSFGSIKSIADFRAGVPVRRYSDFQPDIERIARGEQNVLTAEPVEMFATTSGTIDKPKLIPVTPSFYREFRDVQKLWTWLILNDHVEILRGSFLTLVSPEESGRTEGGIPLGALSGRNYRLQAAVPGQKRLMPVPYRVFGASNFDAKYYTVLRLAAAQDISLISIINPSTILLLCRRLEENAESIIKDVRDGTLAVADKLEPEILEAARPSLKKNPRRARLLQDELDKNGTLNPRRIWPKLALLNCWTAASAAHYAEQLKPLFGDLPMRDFGFNASEGYFSIPRRSGCEGGLLAVNGHFLEFVPHETGREDITEPALSCDQLEAGRCYRPIVTTSGGLYRYDIRDVIKVLDIENGIPVIVFRHRADNTVSLVGEKVTELQIVMVMQRLSKRHGLVLENFFATVRRDDVPRYVFAIEPRTKQNGGTLDAILADADEELKRINMEYKSKRDSMRLAGPCLCVLEKGGTEKYRKARVGEGAHDGQIKMLHLTDDENFLNKFQVNEHVETQRAR